MFSVQEREKTSCKALVVVLDNVQVLTTVSIQEARSDNHAPDYIYGFKILPETSGPMNWLLASFSFSNSFSHQYLLDAILSISGNDCVL